MTVSNTHLLGEVTNHGSSPLKSQRLSDIQDVMEDRYSNANGGDASEAEEPPVEENKNAETTKPDTSEQAKDVAAKEHAKSEPARIFGVKVGYIIGGIVVIGGGIWAYNKYVKK